MKIKVPSQIQFGSHTYKIFLKDIFDDDSDGDALHLEQEILIRAKIPSSRKASVLIHEVIHIVSRVFPTQLGERDVDCLGEGLSQFLFSDLGIELGWSGIKTKSMH